MKIILGRTVPKFGGGEEGDRQLMHRPFGCFAQKASVTFCAKLDPGPDDFYHHIRGLPLAGQKATLRSGMSPVPYPRFASRFLVISELTTNNG